MFMNRGAPSRSYPYILLPCLILFWLLAACSSPGHAPGPKDAAPPKGAVFPQSETPLRSGGRKVETLSPGEKEKAGPAASASRSRPPAGQVDLSWRPLLNRLRADNMSDPIYANYFNNLAAFSADPMGRKIKELFVSAFQREPRPASEEPALPAKARIYPKVVTAAAMEKCRSYLTEYEAYFAAAEKKYAVPREILVALLYVETRLGDYLGPANAFWSLACLAASTTPEQVAPGISSLPLTPAHQGWLRAKLTEKSAWAYRELKALLVYCRYNNLDPSLLPGSVYGAIGLCQFMPSNIIPHGQDGDGDGRVDLFSAPDAVFSVARFLADHGWEQGLSADQQRAVLRRYNNLMRYANTILTLAESARTGVLQTAPPDISP
ncbi:MAG: lytic murein transglycosylase [Desulfovibrio sp.]|jgi:membrane-bound lytic murein transglycosylase B|nr:lytic murein transglycosylase [Desulfovibrio sp.]